MPKTWTEMKEAVAEQMNSDPQRATMSQKAWGAVEEGLRHLTGIGYSFEIAPRGTLAELVEIKSPESVQLTLSIAEGQALVAKPKNEQTKVFDALVAGRQN